MAPHNIFSTALKIFLGAEMMAQLVKYKIDKHEEITLKMLDIVVQACNPGTGRRREGWLRVQGRGLEHSEIQASCGHTARPLLRSDPGWSRWPSRPVEALLMPCPPFSCEPAGAGLLALRP